MSEVKETMEDFASELEASYKEYDARRNNAYQDQEGPDAEKWAELAQQMEDKTVLKVKVKEAVKGGLVAYVDDIQGFIPASQAADHYIEKLEDLVGQHLEVVPITVDMEKKRLVLSARAVLQEKKAAERAEKLASVEVGSVVNGTVDSLKDYGAFVNLENGLSGLLHVSLKITGVKDGKISLSMKALTADGEPEKPVEKFDYKETGEATTGLGALLKGLKF